MNSHTTVRAGAMSLQWRRDQTGAAAAKYQAAGVAALHAAAEFLLEDANRTVPLEEGTLQRSGHASVDPVKMQSAVSYDTPYAARQHEATHYSHAPGRRAKWLEQTTREQTNAIGKFLAGRMRQALR